METPHMNLLPAAAYYEQLASLIPQATNRIVICAMDIRWGKRIRPLIPLLQAAAARGVEVRIVGDQYSKFQARMPRFKRTPSQQWKTIEAANNELRQHGVHVTYIGPLGLNPFANRTHCKITIVDDNIFTFGGVNVTDDMLTDTDYMLTMHDTLLADRLYRLVRAIEADKGPLPDLEELIGEKATLLFDGGTPKQSPIYDTACKLVQEARKVYLVSQMCPSGRLAALLAKTNSTCYFIKHGQADFPANIALLSDQLRHGLESAYHGKAYIHAKFILTVDKHDEKHILSGSNNFSWRGVAYGTKEIAVHSTDTKLWQSFYEYLQDNVVQVS